MVVDNFCKGEKYNFRKPSSLNTLSAPIRLAFETPFIPFTGNQYSVHLSVACGRMPYVYKELSYYWKPAGYTCDPIAVRYTARSYPSTNLPQIPPSRKVPKGKFSFPVSRHNPHEGRAEIVVEPVSTVEIVILPYNMIRFGITEVVLFHTRRYPGLIHPKETNGVRLRVRYNWFRDSRTRHSPLPGSRHSSIDSKAGQWMNLLCQVVVVVK